MGESWTGQLGMSFFQILEFFKKSIELTVGNGGLVFLHNRHVDVYGFLFPELEYVFSMAVFGLFKVIRNIQSVL